MRHTWTPKLRGNFNMAKQLVYRHLFFRRYMFVFSMFFGWPGKAMLSLAITSTKLQAILILFGITALVQDMAPQIHSLRKMRKSAKRKKSNKRARSK